MTIESQAFCPDCGQRLTLEFDPQTLFERVGCDECVWEEADYGVHDSEAQFVLDVEQKCSEWKRFMKPAEQRQPSAVTEPERTEVNFAVNGWRFFVERHHFLGASEFWAVRVGIFENAKKGVQVLAACPTFEQAEAVAEKAQDRMFSRCRL